MATKTLYVGNMSLSSTDASLAAAFSAFEPSNVRVVNNRGFGYLDVAEDQIARTLQNMNGRRLDGRPLTVSVATPNAVAGIERDPGGKGRGGNPPKGAR